MVFFPNQYKEIIELLNHPLNIDQNLADGNWIYFPGITLTKNTTISYILPETCTIFIIAEILDNWSLISYLKNDEFYFSLNKIKYNY